MSKQPWKDESPYRPGYKLIFRASITIKKTGEKIYAKDFGLRAFPIWVPA